MVLNQKSTRVLISIIPSKTEWYAAKGSLNPGKKGMAQMVADGMDLSRINKYILLSAEAEDQPRTERRHRLTQAIEPKERLIASDNCSSHVSYPR